MSDEFLEQAPETQDSEIVTKVDLAIISPEGAVFEGRVDACQVPLEDGLIGIWPGHAPLIAAVSAGAISYDLGSETITLEQGGGILNVGVERCTILLRGAIGPAVETPDREALWAEMADEAEEVLGEEGIEAAEETTPR